MRKVSNLLTVREFFEENRWAWKKHRSRLLFYVVFTLVAWIVEALFNLRILGGLPAHWYPEWFAFFYFGCFAADIKKTMIPLKVVILIVYLSIVLLTISIVGVSGFSLVFSLLFTSPFLMGYLITKIRKAWK